MKRLMLIVVAALMMTGCDARKDSSRESSMTMKQAEQPASSSYTKGLEYLEAGDVNEAIQSFVQAIRENPEDPEPYIILGQIYMRMENHGEAVQAFSAASRVAPDRGDVYYLLALAHGFNGEMDLAKASAERSVEIFSQQRDQENFTRSLALLQSLSRADEEAGAAATDQ